MPKKYKVTNKSGQTVTFIWNAKGKPNKSDLDEIFSQHQEKILARGKEKIANIDKETEQKIGQIPHGQFTQEHPTLSKMLESTEALGGGIAEGAVGLATMPYEVGKAAMGWIDPRVGPSGKSPMEENPELFGRFLTSPGAEEAIPLVPQAKEIASPTSPYGRERAIGQIAGMGVLGAGVGAAMRGVPPETAVTPEVLPPVKGLIPAQAESLQPRGLIEPRPIEAGPVPPPVGIGGGVPPKALPPARPIIVPGEVAKSEAVVTKGEIPPKTQYPYPMPGKVAPVQVLKYDPKTGEAHFLKEGEEIPQIIGVDKGTKLEVKEHQKVSGETEPAAALQDVINAKQESPMTNIPDEDIKAAADMGDATAQEELMRRSGGERVVEPDYIEENIDPQFSREAYEKSGGRPLTPMWEEPRTIDVKPIEETPTTLTPLQAGKTGIERVGEGSPLEELGDVRSLIRSGQVDKLKAKTLFRPVGSNEALVEINGEIFHIDAARRLVNAGIELSGAERQTTWPGVKTQGDVSKLFSKYPKLGIEDFPQTSKQLPQVPPPQDFVTDPSTGRQVPIQHLPPVEPPEPIEFGRPAEGIRVRQEKMEKLRKKSDDILKRLIEEESGSFIPENIWNWVKEKSQTKSEREKSVGFSAARARFGAIQHTLRKNPQTKPIAELFTQAEDYQDIFTSVFSRMANDALKIPLKERVQTWEILNQYFDPMEAVGKADSNGVPFSQKVIQSAIDQRDLFLRIHEMLPLDATKTDKGAGFIPNYITHLREVAAGDTEFAKSFNEIWSQLVRNPLEDIQDFFRAEKTTSKEGADVRLVDRATGKPRSPFVERRNNKITTLETDPLRIWPTYLESIGRLIFRKPVVKIAKGLAGDISEGTTKEAATQYIRHFSGYTDFPNLRSVTGRAVNVALRAGARAVLGLSPRLQELHFGRLLTNVFPELGPRYAATGVAEFLKNPKAAMEQARNLGLAQQSKIPFRMKRAVDKLDYILFWGDLGNTAARAMAYKGFLKRAVDSGLSGQEAIMKAIGDLKDSDQWVGASRYIPLFDPENPIFRSVTQYKVIPTMIADQYARILGQWKSNPMRVMYAAAAAYVGYQAQKHWGIHLFHLSPSNLKFTGAAIENQAAKVLSKIGKGDFAGALKDMIPASGPVEEVLTIGPAASEEEREKYFRSKSQKTKPGGLPPVKFEQPQKMQKAF